MRMTIDEADTILSCERLDSNMGCGASNEDIDEALGVAIDIMRKYQRIEEIVERFKNQYDHTTSMDLMMEIKEVIENDSN